MWYDDESDLHVPSLGSGSISTLKMDEEEMEDIAEQEKNPIGFAIREALIDD